MIVLWVITIAIVVNFCSVCGYNASNDRRGRTSYTSKLASSSQLKLPVLNKLIRSMNLLASTSPDILVTTKTPDFLGLLNYIAATSVQWTLISTFLHFFQILILSNLRKADIVIPVFIVSMLSAEAAIELPKKIISTLPSILVSIFMLFMSLKSRYVLNLSSHFSCQ